MSVSYERLAPFYDALEGDRAEAADDARSLLERHAPDARSVLELACGTGSILARLRDRYGVDRSPAMLRVARKKLRGVELVEADMTTVRLGRRFDAVLCLFDSVNHLLRWREWEALFDRAREHLEPDGVLVFDVNTPRRLAEIAAAPPFVRRFDGNVFVVEIAAARGNVHDWRVSVFERRRGAEYRLHEETIPEAAFPTERIRAALERRFRRVRVVDPRRARPSPRSGRLWFVAIGPRPGRRRA